MRRVSQKHILEVDDQMLRKAGSHGDCMPACLASIFELPLEVFGHRDPGQALYDFLATNYPGISVVTRYFPQRTTEVPYHSGFWIAAVESPRFKDNCSNCSEARETSEPDHGYWRRDECPWCEGTGLAPGWHAIVMENRQVAWDPHPAAEHGFEYSFVGETYLIVTDPSRLVARHLPQPLVR